MIRSTPTQVRQTSTKDLYVDRTPQNDNFDRTTEKMPTRPTVEVYQALEEAFDFFNLHLFENLLGTKLPHVMFTLPKSERFMGYFQPRNWASKGGLETISSEIALNPIFFDDFASICQTLVHEMVHLAQDEYPDVLGKAGKRGYHNKAFARAMISIGLMPSSTGLPGGKQTGVRMSDYVIEHGPFAQALQALIEQGHDMRWSSIVHHNFSAGGEAGTEIATQADIERRRKRRSKTKYTCPVCNTNMYGKPGIRASCLPCAAVFQEQTQ